MFRLIPVFSFLILSFSTSAFAAPTGYKDNAWLYVLGFFGLAGLIGFGQLLTALNKRNIERMHQLHALETQHEAESSDSHTTEHK